MKVITVALVVLIAPALAAEEPKWFLKKDNPRYLAVMANVDSNCPLTVDNVGELVQGELIRSRIVAVDEEPGPALYVNLVCSPHQPAGYPLVSINIEFVSEITESGRSVPIRYGYRGHNSLGSSGSKSIEDALVDAVKRAISDYLLANTLVQEDK